MNLSTISDLKNHPGHYDIFHVGDDLLRNRLALVNIDCPNYKNINGHVSDVVADVKEDKTTIVRIKIRQPVKRTPTLDQMIVSEMDVIYIYDSNGNYTCSEILNRFALIKEGVENGEIEMDFYGVPVYESEPDLMRIKKEDIEGDSYIAQLCFPEIDLNLPLSETLERRIVGLLRKQEY